MEYLFFLPQKCGNLVGTVAGHLLKADLVQKAELVLGFGDIAARRIDLANHGESNLVRAVLEQSMYEHQLSTLRCSESWTYKIALGEGVVDDALLVLGALVYPAKGTWPAAGAAEMGWSVYTSHCDVRALRFETGRTSKRFQDLSERHRAGREKRRYFVGGELKAAIEGTKL